MAILVPSLALFWIKILQTFTICFQFSGIDSKNGIVESFYKNLLNYFPKWLLKYLLCCCFLNYIYKFIDYAITVVLTFPPLPPSTQHPRLPQATPHHCLCPWVICVSSLATPFPILYFTSPWLFCNDLFVLLNLFTHSPTICSLHATIEMLSLSSPLSLFLFV